MPSARPAAFKPRGIPASRYRRANPAAEAIFCSASKASRYLGVRRQFVAAILLALTIPSATCWAQAVTPIEQRFAASLTALPTGNLTVFGAFYVPAYSSVSMSAGKLRADFSVTLSIHNASEQHPVVIRRIGYFDSTGKLVENYLTTPIAMKPFATIEVFVPVNDVRGGTGANFVVDWAADAEIAEPVVEALMMGSVGSGHYAFISQGRRIGARAPH